MPRPEVVEARFQSLERGANAAARRLESLEAATSHLTRHPGEVIATTEAGTVLRITDVHKHGMYTVAEVDPAETEKARKR